jgi:MYXO-CTERM domain-containing protein
MTGLLIASLAARAVEPVNSTATFVSANGFGVLVFDGDRLTEGWNHGYQAWDATTSSVDLLYDSYFGYTDLAAAGKWLFDPEQVRIVDGTGVIESVERAGDLEFTQYAFMPMTYDAWGVVQVTRVRNTSATTSAEPFELTALHNWKPGGGETAVAVDHALVVERGSSNTLWYRAPGATEHTCESAYATVAAGRRLAGDCSFYSSDAVPAFGWDVPALGPGDERWYGVFTATDGTPGWSVFEAGPRGWLRAELEWWGAFHARGTPPAGLSAAETAVYREQLALLKMSQVREPNAGYGQIPASLPVAAPDPEFEHTWNITWVRDSAYATVALARAGYVDEAAASLRFLFQPGKAGKYAGWIGSEPYGVSVCRLYGDGSEWSDEDATGPNIELDNWGLYLWALGETVERSADTALIDELGLRALDTVADPLVAQILAGDQLVRADSSIWERHWYGNEKQFTYTSVMAVAGLRAAADLATRIGDPRASSYAAAAESVAAAIALHLVDVDGVLAGNLTELNAGIGYLDIAAVEAYNFDVLDAKGSTFAPTLAMWDAWLRVPSGIGFARNDDGSAYDTQEWLWADLRLAPALRRACASARASELEDWATQLALANGRQLPELLDPLSAEYEGPTPMLGFGAGVYLLAMQDRADLDGTCAPEVEVPFTHAVEASWTEGCGCASSPGARAAAFAAGLAGLLAARRRRVTPSGR